jgi:trans-aconitate methyltransferase
VPEINMTFDDVAHLYHEVRPRYPEAYFDRIAELVDLANPHVLELGSGTGIATRPMLERGWKVDCIEPGSSLAAVARDQLRDYPDLTISETTFEDWPAESASYDAIVSATAFHWIKPGVRYTKSHQVLKQGGALAVIYYRHVAGGDDAMFEEIQECYLKHMPGSKREKMPVATKQSPSASEMRKSGLFDVVESTYLHQVVTYSRDEYFNLISTYSGHRMLEPEQFDALKSCIGSIIDREGGSIRKAYAQELVIGKRLDV